jgi:hypothetical protein
MKAILVKDLENRVCQLSRDINSEKNAKVKARLVEEQAACKIVLRNLKQHKVKLTPFAGETGRNPVTGRRLRGE